MKQVSCVSYIVRDMKSSLNRLPSFLQFCLPCSPSSISNVYSLGLYFRKGIIAAQLSTQSQREISLQNLVKITMRKWKMLQLVKRQSGHIVPPKKVRWTEQSNTYSSNSGRKNLYKFNFKTYILLIHCPQYTKFKTINSSGQ